MLVDRMDALEALVEKYIESAIIQGRECWGGDVKLANKHSLMLTEYYCDLCMFGKKGLDALSNLLYHENAYVRLNAAFDLLPFRSRESAKALRALLRERSEISLRAENALIMWGKGLSRFAVKRNGEITDVSAKELVCYLQTEWAKQGEDFGGLYAHKRHGRNTLSHYIRVLREYIRK